MARRHRATASLPASARLDVSILSQPDDTTCGATCLHAVYTYHGFDAALDHLLRDVQTLDHGGTLEVLLANHALARGFGATIYTYNVQLFDPTWFEHGPAHIHDRLIVQAELKDDVKLRLATEAYLGFLSLGGNLRHDELTAGLICRHLAAGQPVIAGLCATYLYGCPREVEDKKHQLDFDDVRGEPTGHFVVLCGYDRATRRVLVADPLRPNPLSDDNYYTVPISRLIAAILLGVLTYDANLLVVNPRD